MNCILSKQQVLLHVQQPRSAADLGNNKQLQSGSLEVTIRGLQMKNILVATIMLLTCQLSFAGSLTPQQQAALTCRRTFVSNLFYCGSNFRSLPRSTRLGATRGCIADAYSDLKVCLKGQSNSCITACKATYDTATALCVANNDPSQCGTDEGCRQIVLERQAVCNDLAASNLTSCNNRCPQ